jgi:hypothetical protein
MSKRKISPFTQETLQEIYEDNGIITIDLIADELKGWSFEEIKNRLNQWRYRGVISYVIDDGEIQDFKFLRDKKAEKQEMNEGKRLKIDIYFRQVQATLEIMEKSTASDTNRLKAIQLQQQALNEIPDDLYKELTEVYS